MQYIVSLSQPYAIPNDDDALAYLLSVEGYETIEELAEDYEEPTYLTMSAPDLAEELHGATLEDELDSDTYVDREGYVTYYDDIEERTTEMLNDNYGEIEVAGIVFDAGYVLAELDSTAFRGIVLDYMDDEYFESWDEWHNAVA